MKEKKISLDGTLLKQNKKKLYMTPENSQLKSSFPSARKMTRDQLASNGDPKQLQLDVDGTKTHAVRPQQSLHAICANICNAFQGYWIIHIK